MPKALLFASIRQIAGTGEASFAADTLRELLRACVDAYGDAFASQLEHCTILVNGSQTQDLDIPVTDADEIAILPPVSGGTSCRSLDRSDRIAVRPIPSTFEGWDLDGGRRSRVGRAPA